MLEKLNLENFKCWRAADISFGKITGLFGTNSSGKSSLMQFLLILKQTKEATDRAVALSLSGNYADVGVFQDAVYQHDGSKEIKWNVSFKLPTELLIEASGETETRKIASGTRLGVSSAVKETKKGLISNFLKYSLDDSRFLLEPKSERSDDFDLKARAGSFRFKRNVGRKWPIPGPVKSYGFPDQARTYFQNAGFLADLEKAYEDTIDKIFHLGPLRDYPKRQYLLADTKPQDVGPKGEFSVSAIRAMTVAGERRKVRPNSHTKPFQEVVAYWLAQIGVVSDFRVDEIKKGTNLWQAYVKVRQHSPDVLLTDVGFGVSQVLPIVTLLQYVPEGSIVLLEQPEIHLHPLAQANLADAIISASQTRNIQVIVESHSEHFLLRLQRRIADGTVDHRDVNLFFCDAPKGLVSARRLELDLYGNILNWPDKFMGDQFGETAEAEIARLNRMREVVAR